MRLQFQSSRHLLLLALLLLPPAVTADERPVVAGTFSLVSDWIAAVTGDHAEVRNLTPVGAEVHEWELQARNFADLEEADLVFYNGLMLEQWMPQVEAVVGGRAPIVSLAGESGVETLPIVTGDFAGDPDPHLWMDPANVRAYVDVIARHLARIDPGNAQVYRDNAAAYGEQLDTLDRDLRERLAVISAEKRTLITSEAAFIYFADAYNFFHDGIWGSNAEVEGSPRQIMRITDIITERRPAALFWESTISDRHVRTLADDHRLPVAGPLYVDSVGPEGSGAGDYLSMMRRNAEVIIAALVEAE